MKIAVIDSGLNVNHKAFKNGLNITKKIHIWKNQQGELLQDDMIQDDIGHGTSVVWLIDKYAPNSELIIVKIFDCNHEVDEEILLRALEYIYTNVQCDVINISAGLTTCTDIQQLEKICCAIKELGITIIAAFDNDGAMSYPAAFSTVIGVDFSLSCFTPKQFTYIDNSPVNVRGMGYSQFLPTVNDQFCEQVGASFVAPLITGLFCQAKESGQVKSVTEYLIKNAKKVFYDTHIDEEGPLDIKSVLIFPVSKETKALIEHARMLNFKIEHVYDIKYSGNVGKSLSEIVYPGCSIESYLVDKKVESIEDIDFSDTKIDTLIIGHTNMLQVASHRGELKDVLLRSALEHKKQVYMYDYIGYTLAAINEIRNTAKNQLRIPLVQSINVPQYQYGKLYKLSVPVLGVFGTSPKQGKFTLQLRLREELRRIGYSIANFGTEPESELFGFESTYPIGYNSTVNISGSEAITYINSQMHMIERKNPDLIIVGSQSQSLATSSESLGYMPTGQYELIMGAQPDAYILCVNTTDDMLLIKRTISYLTSVIESHVLALVVSPIIYHVKNGYMKKVIKYVQNDVLEEYILKLEKELSIPAFSLSDSTLVHKLQKKIEDFFS